MTEFVLVSTTTASADEAEQIAQALLNQRLAACVQIIPQVRSIYRWAGEIEQAGEWLCLIKTRRSLLSHLEAAVIRQHSYDCPEIVAVPISGVRLKIAATGAGFLSTIRVKALM